MTIACGYMDTGATARKEFRRLINDGSEYQQEIVASCNSLHFPGQRGLSIAPAVLACMITVDYTVTCCLADPLVSIT
jgi:hypothetical protein